VFDVDKLACLSSIYHVDIGNGDRETIRGQLDTYIHHVRIHSYIFTCINLECLVAKMVKSKEHLVFSLVYERLE
jgi:hypothetical protein